MNHFFQLLKKDWFLFLFTGILILFFQFELIVNDPILEYDDKGILKPITQGLYPWVSGYFEGIYHGKIPDFQPVRDISLSLDIIFKKISGLGIHHLHNVVIWIFSGILFFKILLLLKINRSISILFYFLFFFNPVLWNAVCWISARKHLLSGFFIIWATYELLKVFEKKELSGKKIAIISLLYFLACFAQPINVGWSLFAVLMIFLVKKEIKFSNFKILILTLFSICALAIAVNLYYYKIIYPMYSEYPKFLNHPDSENSFRILSLGRHYLQALLSFWPTPTPYYAGNPINFLGILVLVLFFFLIYKTKNKIIYLWGLLSLLPLLVVTFKITNIFGNDTYLIITVFSCYICLALILNNLPGIRKFLLIIGIIFLIPFLILDAKIAKSFQTTKSLFTLAYEQDPTPFNLRTLVREFIVEKRFDEGLGMATQLISWDPYFYYADEMYSKIVYYSKRLLLDEKIKLLRKTIKDSPELVWSKYFYGVLVLQKNQIYESVNILRTINPNYLSDFGSTLPNIMAHIQHICEISKTDCTDIKKLVNIAKKNEFWDESKFIEQSKLYKSSR